MKHPLDPKEKLSDEQYNKVVDTIQNERYAEWLFWKRVWKILRILAIIFLCIAIIFLFIK